jgi:NADH dehydrogenase
MLAKIFQPARNAMQSGQAKTKQWILEFAPEQARSVDPLMGWSSSGDMNAQVRLTFDSKDAAIAYATKHSIAYRVSEPHKRKPVVRAGGYGENFATNRRRVWTH